jgi:endonuclease YncB( thermonuclease family)
MVAAGISTLLMHSPALAQERAKVLSIHNGQQLLIEVNGQGRTLRLACLQAPRSQQRPWSTRALAVIQELVRPGDVGDFELRARDVYGRLVGRFLINGQDLGAELVRRGAVFSWDGFLGRCDDLDYDGIKAKAQAARRGIWSAPAGVKRPWDVMEASNDGEP